MFYGEELEGEKIIVLVPKYVALESIQEKPTYAPAKPKSIKMAGISRVATSPRGFLEYLSLSISMSLFSIQNVFYTIYIKHLHLALFCLVNLKSVKRFLSARKDLTSAVDVGACALNGGIAMPFQLVDASVVWELW